MNFFFTGDTHFSHANIIKYSKRPFSGIFNHDSGLIQRWNETVSNADIVYHVGDFIFAKHGNAVKYFLDQLNYKELHIISGNHDHILHDMFFHHQNMDYVSMFEFQPNRRTYFYRNPYLEIKIENQLIVLSHYAMKIWNKSHYGSYHLYGHSHGSLPDDLHSRSFDVGVDCHNYTPISIQTVHSIMSKKIWKSIDHHEPRNNNQLSTINDGPHER